MGTTAFTMHDAQRSLALLLFTEQFAILVESGVTLANCLEMLGNEAMPPFAAAARKMRQQIVEDGATLTRAVAAHPDLFSPTYCTMVRVGEVGGIVEQALRLLADLLREEWKFSCLIAEHQGHPVRLISLQITTLDSLGDLTALERTLVQLLFCRAFGMMLASGVPVSQAMETSAGLLPAAERDAWLREREGVRAGDGYRLSAPFLPVFANALLSNGEKEGRLEQALERIAEYFARELDSRLWFAVVSGEQAAQTPWATDEAPKPATPYDEPVIRMANIIIVDAIRENASEIVITFDLAEGKETPDLVVRYLTDTGMNDVMTMPVFAHKPLVDRIKLMAQMDLDEDRQHQEGAMSVMVEGRSYQIAVSSVLGAFGEGLILRFVR